MIAIIDYGMGNLRSVHNAFKKLGREAVITSDRETVSRASHLVLPGVGAFSECMDQLRSTGLIAPILEAIQRGKPFLGICLGFQLLFSKSDEFGEHQGLNVISGEVKKFPDGKLKVPHIGWNQVRLSGSCPVFKGIPSDAYFYFDHSYYAIPTCGSVDPKTGPEKEAVTASWTDYGVKFTSSVWRDNLFACQFHPEKSQTLGLKLLENFGGLS